VKRDKADAALKQATEMIDLITDAALLTAGFHTHHRQWRRKNARSGPRIGEQQTAMTSKPADNQKPEDIREQFHALLTKANKERPNAADIQALKDLLYDNKEMELWKAIIGMGELAESQALDTIVNGSGQGMRECWRQRLQAMRADVGYTEASALERLLIQQVSLCWLNLNLTAVTPNRVSIH
jgi:hypothetical protein